METFMPSFHTTREVAQRYRTAESTVRYWRHVGYGPKGVRVGRRILYSDDALQAFDRQVAEQQAAADPQGAA
jgi:DNA-binding transcriptional MerR regulator